MAALLCVTMLLSGFSLSSNVTLDPERNRIYREVSAEEMIKALADNEALAEKTYDGQYLAIRGIVKEVSGNGRTVTVAPYKEQKGDASVRVGFYDEALRADAAGFVPGDPVCVCGRASFSRLPSASLNVTGQKIERATGTGASGAAGIFRFLNGERVDAQALEKRSSQNSEVIWTIPGQWKRVETVTDDYRLYRLNELPGEQKSEPEQLYVFYFDNEKYLLDLNDRTRTTEIEKAIIKNILPNERIGFGRFPKRRDVYGHAFHYYDTGYGGYHAEFAFTPDQDNGVFCLLYIYETSDHLDDILMLMRLLEFRG
ncbi:MAG: OB-fold putative lipoprotein [Lachnospiraceae bacterium]|nr:OB-fold putative lipoprotein [Lachnospiraceae bacterium]